MRADKWFFFGVCSSASVELTSKLGRGAYTCPHVSFKMLQPPKYLIAKLALMRRFVSEDGKPTLTKKGVGSHVETRASLYPS